MFTGIIETTGLVKELEINGSNVSFWIESSIAHELKIDQSVSHNGVCLTVEAIVGNKYKVTAIEETLLKTTFSLLQVNNIINLERSMRLNERLDGHLVQGHVDCTGKCIAVEKKSGSWEYSFTIYPEFSPLIVEKGSIALNGISLTIFNITQTSFTIAIIPYTFEHTNINQLKIEDRVNIEFDVIGKYVQRNFSVIAIQ